MGSDDHPTFSASRLGGPSPDPPDWVDGAPTTGRGQSCAFCGSDHVTWVHPLARDLLTYQVDGESYTLPTFWTLCDRCEEIHAGQDVQAAVDLMRSSGWSWVADDEIAECLLEPLAVFRRADLGARQLDR